MAKERTKRYLHHAPPSNLAKVREEQDLEAFKPSSYPVLEFEEDAWRWFSDACADLEIALDEGKKQALEQIYSHLLGVNEWLNLTRILSQKDYLKFHVFDSLTVLNLVEENTDPGDVVVDLGSGGGYPGLPLALWLPDRKWRLVDSRAKKVLFLKEAIRLTGCRFGEARSFRGREVAAFARDLEHKCRLVTARAVGRIVDLLPDAQALLSHNGIFLVMKGQAYPTEERDEVMAALPRQGFTLMEEHQIALDDDDPDRWVIMMMKTE